MPHICHNRHNCWLYKKVQPSVKFSNWNAKKLLYATNLCTFKCNIFWPQISVLEKSDNFKVSASGWYQYWIDAEKYLSILTQARPADGSSWLSYQAFGIRVQLHLLCRWCFLRNKQGGSKKSQDQSWKIIWELCKTNLSNSWTEYKSGIVQWKCKASKTQQS